MRVVEPYSQGNGQWRGDSPGTMRKRFLCFGEENSLDFCSVVTIYAPGEGSVFHNHPGAEELGYVIAGAGVLQDMEQNITARIQKGQLFLVEKGEIHRIFNNGAEPLIVLMVCPAKTPLPEG